MTLIDLLQGFPQNRALILCGDGFNISRNELLQVEYKRLFYLRSFFRHVMHLRHHLLILESNLETVSP